MKNIYVCGPTVYSKVHIGNMRPILTFDIYIRAIKYLGEDVKFIHNITDIDDKIIARAKEEKTTEKELVEKYYKHYLEQLESANVTTITSMPRVMENIDMIIKFIEKLINEENAYEVNGSIYFDTTSIEGYGKLSNQNIEEQKNKENSEKRNPQDFVLWKKTTDGILFDSPWSKGRPGWHTECAAFINKEMKGDSLNIHGGGNDLMFPHHENENAQYKALNKKEISKEWVHTGHINLDGKKMSKSIGNIWNSEDFFKEFSADVLRYIFLTTSVTSPINISEELIESSKKKIDGLRKDYIEAKLTFDSKKNDVSNIAKMIKKWDFAQANKMVNLAIKNYRKNKGQETAGTLVGIADLIGYKFTTKKISNTEKKLFLDWEKARSNQDWKEADKLRKELHKKELI